MTLSAGAIEPRCSRLRGIPEAEPRRQAVPCLCKDSSIRYMKHHYWRKKGVIVPTPLPTSRYRIARSNKKTLFPYLYIASYIGVAARSEEARRAELG